jgi:Na+/H+-dicarboxylate symporter
VGVPLDGLGILLGIDRIPDMFRTVVNVTGNVVATAVVRRTADTDAGP